MPVARKATATAASAPAAITFPGCRASLQDGLDSEPVGETTLV
jgi:hypothetical protein